MINVEIELPHVVLPKEYVRVKDVVEILAVKVHVIRYWCDRHKLAPKRTRAGQRVFNVRDVQKLLIIRALRDYGMNDNGIQRALGDIGSEL